MARRANQTGNRGVSFRTGQVQVQVAMLAIWATWQPKGLWESFSLIWRGFFQVAKLCDVIAGILAA
jgi:hypothetical protein